MKNNLLKITVSTCLLVQHLYPKVTMSAATNTILFQQNLKMTISAGGALIVTFGISALPFLAKRAYNSCKK